MTVVPQSGQKPSFTTSASNMPRVSTSSCWWISIGLSWVIARHPFYEFIGAFEPFFVHVGIAALITNRVPITARPHFEHVEQVSGEADAKLLVRQLAQIAHRPPCGG